MCLLFEQNKAAEFGLRHRGLKRTARKVCQSTDHSSGSSGSGDGSEGGKAAPHKPKPAIMRRMRGRSSSDASSDERCSSRPVAGVVRAGASGRKPGVVQSRDKVHDAVGGDGVESSSSQGSFESFSRPQRVAEGAGGKAAAKPKKVLLC